MRKIIRSLAISSFGILLLRIKGRGVSVPMYLDEEIYTQPCDFPIGILILRIKGRGVSVPMYHDREIYTQPCDFPIGILILRIKGKTSPSPCTTTGKIIRSLEISLFQTSHSAYKGRDVSVPMYLDEEIYTQPCDFPLSESSFCV